MKKLTVLAASVSAALLAMSLSGNAANHREAPITALDHKADITDVFAFRSYAPGAGDRVTMIVSVDPFLDTANGPNWSPFDPDILYEIKVDNTNDAVEDIVFQFRFTTQQRLPGLFQVFAGAGNGIAAPANSPAPVAPGTAIVPPRITDFNSPGCTVTARSSDSKGHCSPCALAARSSTSRGLPTRLSRGRSCPSTRGCEKNYAQRRTSAPVRSPWPGMQRS